MEFDSLTPMVVMQAVEAAYGVRLDGSVQQYPSYINRVYGVHDEDGTPLIVKFYRPGRWSDDAILDEHQFLLDLAEAEVPVIAPIPSADGATLQEVAIGEDSTYRFTLFPKQGGRSFEGESDEDLRRLGMVVGRCHAVGATAEAEHRMRLSPTATTAAFASELIQERVVPPQLSDEFAELVESVVAASEPRFAGIQTLRIHGDLHRGNLLSRGDGSLVMIDLDDMMVGPAVQDLWMLLPDHIGQAQREFGLIADGYGQFADFDELSVRLIEPLRFMRMIYFLTWQARQRHDYWFDSAYPGWGSDAFWSKEIEDLRMQARYVV